MSERSGVLVLDIPVPHKGFIDLLNKHATLGKIHSLLLVGEDLRAALDLPREIRANDPEIIKRMLLGLNLPFNVEVLDLDRAVDLPQEGIYTGRDIVSRRLREIYFPGSEVTEEDVFLRWDSTNVTSTRPVHFDEETRDPLHQALMRRTEILADFSSDWWRRVGVVINKEGRPRIEAYNQAFPTDHQPYIDGNPRDYIEAGTLGFLASTAHAEPSAIAKAARFGIRTDGSDLYLNSFPCQSCAIVMGHAGIKRCFFSGGNAYLDAADVLKAIGIKTIFVNKD